MSKKYKITTQSIEWGDKKLFRIQALKSFGSVKAGDLGGYIESENNLSQDGDSWVYNTAKVYDKAIVWDNVEIHDNAEVFEDSWVYGNAWVCGNSKVFGSAGVYGDVWIYNNAEICDNVRVHDNARVFGNTIIRDNTNVYGYAEIGENAEVHDDADYICVKGLGSAFRDTTFFKCKNDDISVVCGCFNGNLEKFSKKVRNTHGYNKYAKEYLAMIEVVKIHFGKENNNE